MAKTILHTTKAFGGSSASGGAHKQVMTSPSPASTAAKPGITPPSKPSPSTVQRVGVTGPGAKPVGKMKKGC